MYSDIISSTFQGDDFGADVGVEGKGEFCVPTEGE